MSKKLADLIFKNAGKSKALPQVIHPIFAGRHLPSERLAYISDKEAQMLRTRTDGKSDKTQWGPQSFTDPSQAQGYTLSSTPTKTTSSPTSITKSTGPTGGLGSNYSPTSAYTSSTGSKSAPSPSTGNGSSAPTGNGSTGPSGGLGSNYSSTSAYTSSNGSSGPSASSLGNGGSFTTNGGTSQPVQSQNAFEKLIDNTLGWGAQKPVSGESANWNVSTKYQDRIPQTGNTVSQGINFAPADYMAAGYGQYQQPPSATSNQASSNNDPKEISFQDWQVGTPTVNPINRVSGGYGAQAFSPALHSANTATYQAAGVKMQDRIAPEPDIRSQAYNAGVVNLQNQLSQYRTPPNPQVQSASWDGQLPPAIPSSGAPSYDMSYLTGNKASSALAGFAKPLPIAGVNGGNALGIQPYEPTQLASNGDPAITNSDIYSNGFDNSGRITGPEQMPDPAGYTIPSPIPQSKLSAALLGKGGPYMPQAAPFDQVAYDEKRQQVMDNNASSFPVVATNVAKHTPLGALGFGLAGMIQKQTGGLYGNENYGRFNNDGMTAPTGQGSQGTPDSHDNSPSIVNQDLSSADILAIREEMKTATPERRKELREILHGKGTYKPPIGTGTGTASAGPIGAAYSLATSQGNYIIDSRGNYFMMGPDRSYIQVPPPQGLVA